MGCMRWLVVKNGTKQQPSYINCFSVSRKTTPRNNINQIGEHGLDHPPSGESRSTYRRQWACRLQQKTERLSHCFLIDSLPDQTTFRLFGPDRPRRDPVESNSHVFQAPVIVLQTDGKGGDGKVHRSSVAFLYESLSPPIGRWADPNARDNLVPVQTVGPQAVSSVKPLESRPTLPLRTDDG